jgi:hypothetical protein
VSSSQTNTLSSQNLDKNFLTLYQFLKDETGGKKFVFITELLNLKKSEFEILYEAITTFYIEIGEIGNLLQTTFKNLIESYSQEENTLLFREDSLATKLFKCYISNDKFTDFINFCLGPLAEPPLAEKTLELDPNKLKKKWEGDKNAIELRKITQKFLENICCEVDRCPIELRMILSSIACEVKNTFPSMSLVSVGNLLFLRFLTPVLIARSTNKNIAVIVMKTVNNIINKIQFGEKEGFMCPMNEVINQKNISMLEYYLENIVDPSLILKNMSKKISGDTITHNIIVSIDVIKSYIVNNIEEIIKICSVKSDLTNGFIKFIAALIHNIDSNPS